MGRRRPALPVAARVGGPGGRRGDGRPPGACPRGGQMGGSPAPSGDLLRQDRAHPPVAPCAGPPVGPHREPAGRPRGRARPGPPAPAPAGVVAAPALSRIRRAPNGHGRPQGQSRNLGRVDRGPRAQARAAVGRSGRAPRAPAGPHRLRGPAGLPVRHGPPDRGLPPGRLWRRRGPARGCWLIPHPPLSESRLAN